MNKKYTIINDDIINTGKGLVNNTFTRYIANANSIFGLFIRSFGHRKSVDERQCRFIIVDKNIKHIEMFKELLKWDGNILDLAGSTLFFKDAAKKIGVDVEPFNVNLTIGKISRHDFNDFTSSWVKFKNSEFIFYNIDIDKDLDKFMNILYRLPSIGYTETQFVSLNFRRNNISNYDFAINEILHLLWMKSLRQYPTVVELVDEENNRIENYAGKLYAKFNPTFCILPWMHIQYKPSGQSKLCCRYDTVKEGKDWQNAFDSKLELDNLAEKFQDRSKNHLIQVNSMEQSFFSNYWDKARQLTLENKEISGCHKCYKEEEGKGEVSVSMRLGSSILYNDGYLHKKPKHETPTIEFLEVGFGNYCNLACLSCNSTLSTTWHDDEVKFNAKVDDKLKRYVFPKLDNLKFEPDEKTLESLRIIKFTGGEPMINPEFTKFIELICEKGYPENISLEIYTNCSYVPSPKLLSNLTKFKNIQLNLSIDAYGSVNDYIRYGSQWDGEQKQTVSNAIEFWLGIGREHENFSIIMSTTLSILNIFEIPKLMTWWMDKFKDSGNKINVYRTSLLASEYDGFFKIQLAHDPSYINIDILPAEYYKEIIEWVETYRSSYTTKYPDLNGIPECINASLIKLKQAASKTKGNAEEGKNLLTYLSTMDSIRKNSADQSIPKLISCVKEYLQAQGKQI